MAAPIVAELDAQSARRLSQLVRQFGSERLRGSLLRPLQRLALDTAGYISRTKLSGQQLGVRTGTLRRSITGQAVADIAGFPGLKVGIFQGPALAYAGIHETGGVIRPKRAKSLAIPVGDAVLTPAGVHRYESPRDYPSELNYIPTRDSGLTVGVLVDPDRGVQYALVSQVRIPARPYLKPGVTERLPAIASTIGRLIRRILTE